MRVKPGPIEGSIDFTWSSVCQLNELINICPAARTQNRNFREIKIRRDQMVMKNNLKRRLADT